MPPAAGVAGVLFALLLGMTLCLLRLSGGSWLHASPGWFNQERFSLVLGATPFAGIAFLWFIGVVRDRIGEREDRFLATVSLGSGLLFVALLFAASAVATGVLAEETGAPWTFGRKLAAILLHTYAMRMAAVFMLSTSTIGLRTGFSPRWIALLGYLVAVVLLLGIRISLWVELLFPFWVLVLSLQILAETYRHSPGSEASQRVTTQGGAECEQPRRSA